MPDAARTVAADWVPNLTWITPRLAVGGRFPMERAGDLARHHGLRALVDLRLEACDDAAVLAGHGLAFLHLPTEDHAAVGQAGLDEGVRFANDHLDRGGRVLVHCEHGIGRSATLALCVLVSRGAAPLDALELAKSRRPLVSPSPAQYEDWIAWLRRWRGRAGADWPLPDFDTFAAIAYRHLRDAPG
ncbi:protein-tyrosine phosphatase family protein [Prosthecomicrobium sp. N25]|uniref:protein-tyrosine phosphatase family protein n=1 Tax=Prosthecomicrobium sp. N25 TaxID=3129254 RepID=UPI00307790FA